MWLKVNDQMLTRRLRVEENFERHNEFVKKMCPSNKNNSKKSRIIPPVE